jgi:hypothetical protein
MNCNLSGHILFTLTTTYHCFVENGCTELAGCFPIPATKLAAKRLIGQNYVDI